MGLGLHFQADLTRSTDIDDAYSKIVATASDHAEALGLRVFFSSRTDEGKLHLELHPAAEWVQMELLEGGTLDVYAKTSSVGPGYHQYVIQLLDAVARDLGICWEIGEDVEGDDTGYFEHRDFSRLQEEMADLLRNLAWLVHEQCAEGLSGLMLNMPVNFPILGIEGIITPSGVFPVSTFEQALGPDFDISSFAERFFLWWDEGTTATTWESLGLTLMWCGVPWHVPNDEDERDLCNTTLMCFDRAHALDPAKALPNGEIAELAGLLVEEPDWSREPAATGIGYHRLMWRQTLSSHWSVELPGYFYHRLENDNATDVFWLGDKEVWATTFTINPAKLATLSDLADRLKPDSLVREEEHFVACANVEPKQADDGSRYCTMSCLFQASGTSAILTIVYPDEAAFAWAEQVFRSVRFLPGDDR